PVYPKGRQSVLGVAAMHGRRLTVILVSLFLLATLPDAEGQARAQDQAQLDEQLLKTAGLPTDTEGLLTFFKQRSLKDSDRGKFEELVRTLGSKSFKERTYAEKELLVRGPLALAFLKAALKDG